MTRLHDVSPKSRPTAYLVGVPTQAVTDAENESSLDELSRLVQTLGYDVIGRTSQRRSGTGGAFVLGEGKIVQLAKLTGGAGAVSAGPQVPQALNPKRKKAFLNQQKAAQQAAEQAAEQAAADQDDDNADHDNADFGNGSEFVEPEESAAQSGTSKSSELEALTGAGGKAPDAVIFDLELTPSQLRNLERALGCDVLDRTGVIIEIFSRHARTRAARLQVEIAKLTYLAPRIRETGGESGRQGSTRGAGETSVELDRRKIRDRIKELKQEFASIDDEHDTRRARRSELRTVALVGYTNAGKSSMMRAMTGSEVYVADKLFATLDTTVRPLHPQVRPQILLSDTVGFIKKLPHDLVASFKSTLDEALNASLLLYIVDASDASFRSQLETTQSVLKEVGVTTDIPSFLILNKSDKLTEAEKLERQAEFPDAIVMSTKDPADLERLRDRFILFFEGEMVDEELFIPYGIQSPIGEIRANMKVLDEAYDNGGVRLTVRATREALNRLRARFQI
jgi:GTP-binding protein HflX